MMSIAILVVMFFLGMVGKGKGVVNYKFTIEKIVLTLLLTPLLANFVKGKLVAFIPEMAASISGVVLGLVIVFIIIGLILGKVAKIPEYEDTGADHSLGFVAGVLKGFILMAFLIFMYGISFADIKLPGMITQQMKNNFVNSRIENSIEYYRTSIYAAYRSAKSTDVGELSSSSDQYSDTSVVSYVPWAGNYISPPEETKPEPEKEKK
ncbi:MAG: CvpA family protein [Candidatus Delongbacteria bacterium]|nr:CvpA family protein [Candidatus Delongbacteria bacterium]